MEARGVPLGLSHPLLTALGKATWAPARWWKKTTAAAPYQATPTLTQPCVKSPTRHAGCDLPQMRHLGARGPARVLDATAAEGWTQSKQQRVMAKEAEMQRRRRPQLDWVVQQEGQPPRTRQLQHRCPVTPQGQ